MELEVLFGAIESLAVVAGVGVGIYEVRRYRRDRNREAALELLHAFETPQFAKAMVLTIRLPDGLTKPEVEARLGADLHLVVALLYTWESIGVLVYRGEIALDLVDDFFSGPITLSWRRLRGFVEGERADTGRDTLYEWFQWLAERFADRERDGPPVPANILHQDWRPD